MGEGKKKKTSLISSWVAWLGVAVGWGGSEGCQADADSKRCAVFHSSFLPLGSAFCGSPDTSKYTLSRISTTACHMALAITSRHDLLDCIYPTFPVPQVMSSLIAGNVASVFVHRMELLELSSNNRYDRQLI